MAKNIKKQITKLKEQMHVELSDLARKIKYSGQKTNFDIKALPKEVTKNLATKDELD